jgi:hypothetical protein
MFATNMAKPRPPKLPGPRTFFVVMAKRNLDKENDVVWPRIAKLKKFFFDFSKPCLRQTRTTPGVKVQKTLEKYNI